MERHEAHVGERLVEECPHLRQQPARVGRRHDQLFMLGAVPLGHEARERTLVEASLRVAHREGPDARPLSRGRRGDRRRVDASAEKAAERHVARHAEPDGLVEASRDLLAPGHDIDGGVGRGRNVPVRPGRDLVVGKGQRVAGRQLGHAADHRVGSGNEVVGEIAGDRVRIELATDRGVGQHGVQLGGEHDPASARRIVERLLAHPVPGQQELLSPRVPDREGEHPVEVVDTVLAVLLPRVHDRFRVRSGDEAMAEGGQLPPKSHEVVDLSVLNHVDRRVFVGDRLIAGLEVDDPQSRRTEGHAAVDVVADRVGAAVAKGGDHPLQDAPVGACVGWGDEAGDAAHGPSVRPRASGGRPAAPCPAGW